MDQVIKSIEKYLSKQIKKGTWEHNKVYNYLVDVRYNLQEMKIEEMEKN